MFFVCESAFTLNDRVLSDKQSNALEVSASSDTLIFNNLEIVRRVISCLSTTNNIRSQILHIQAFSVSALGGSI